MFKLCSYEFQEFLRRDSGLEGGPTYHPDKTISKNVFLKCSLGLSLGDRISEDFFCIFFLKKCIFIIILHS